MIRTLLLAAILAGSGQCVCSGTGQAFYRTVRPWHIDDQKTFRQISRKSSRPLAGKAKGKCLSAEEDRKKRLASSVTLKRTDCFSKTQNDGPDPEDLYESILPSVVILGSVKTVRR